MLSRLGKIPTTSVRRRISRVAGKRQDDLVFTFTLGAPLRNGNFRRRAFQPAVAECRATDPTFPIITPHDSGTRPLRSLSRRGHMSKQCSGCSAMRPRP